MRVKQKATKKTKNRGTASTNLTFVRFVSFCPIFRRVCRIFFINSLSSCTYTSLYLICSTGCKQNSYDFFGGIYKGHDGHEGGTRGETANSTEITDRKSALECGDLAPLSRSTSNSEAATSLKETPDCLERRLQCDTGALEHPCVFACRAVACCEGGCLFVVRTLTERRSRFRLAHWVAAYSRLRPCQAAHPPVCI